MIGLAVVLAVLAARLGVRPGGLVRVRPPTRPLWRTPAWAEPRPDAMAARQRWTLGLVAGAAVVAVTSAWWGVVAGPLLAVAIAVALGRLEPPSVQRRRLQRAGELPQTLELLAGCLAAGQPLRRATAVVARASGEAIAADLEQVLAAVEVGMSEREAWQRLQGDQAWRLVVRDVARAAEAGTALVEVLRAHAARARDERAATLQRRARTVGVRSVFPLVACFLPAFLLVGIVPAVGAVITRLLGG